MAHPEAYSHQGEPDTQLCVSPKLFLPGAEQAKKKNQTGAHRLAILSVPNILSSEIWITTVASPRV